MSIPRPESTSCWPYPLWIAHRGAGQLAPENTLAAFQLGLRHGYRMFECDVQLSSDGIPFLLHDLTLTRTTNYGALPHSAPELLASDCPWSLLAQLDAGSWHSQAYAGEPLATLETIAHFCLKNDCFVNIEIKPAPGLERASGEVIAQHVTRLWEGAAVQPLLSSFCVESLQAVQASRPTAAKGLLLDTLWPGWLETALQLQCVAVICKHILWNATHMAQVKTAGLRCLSYTVNEPAEAERLIQLGIDGLITDKVNLFPPAA